jgi:hypothetical protein
VEHKDIIKTDSDNLLKMHQSVNGLATMTTSKIEKISERMLEIDRAINTLGRKNTQTTIQMMTLTMLSDTPYRRLRQCIIEINKKRDALRASYYRLLKQQYRIKKWKEKGDEFSLIKAEESEAEMAASKIYIDGALKEIATLQEAYLEIQKNHNIPDDWDEEDAEMDEIQHHLRQAIRQSHRDMTLSGTISQGNAEYLEQYGVHLQVATKVIGDYINECNRMMKEDDKVPNINHYYEFLDNTTKLFSEEYKKVLTHIGLDNLVRQEFLYRSNK